MTNSLKMICRYLMVLCLLVSLVQGAKLRRLRPRQQESKGTTNKKAPTLWKRQPVGGGDATSVGGDTTSKHGGDSRRRLLNGGRIFITSHQTNDGVESCMDAVEGTVLADNGQYPSVGFRPCAYMAGPSEQLFLPTWGGELQSNFPGDFCLVVDVEDNTPQDGDRVRLGPCKTNNDDGSAISDFHFDENAMINGRGQITAAGNPNLCVTYEGNNPDDDDRMVLKTCKDSDKFFFSFRTGWYELGGSGCVQVRNDKMEVRNRVVYDTCQGFGGHWRIDGDGLFHSRRNDQYCMRAVETEEGSPIRIALCDSTDDNQRWEWPDGFEAPINLVSHPGLYLVVQGQTADFGNNMVLGTAGQEWSGDSVHI